MRIEKSEQIKVFRQKNQNPLLTLKDVKQAILGHIKSIHILRYGKVCYTCDKKGLEHINCQLGHFITKSTCSAPLAYSTVNTRIQCYECNITKDGNVKEFEKRLIREKGREFILRLQEQNRKTKGGDYDMGWYLARLEQYKTEHNRVLRKN